MKKIILYIIVAISPSLTSCVPAEAKYTAKKIEGARGEAEIVALKGINNLLLSPAISPNAIAAEKKYKRTLEVQDNSAKIEANALVDRVVSGVNDKDSMPDTASIEATIKKINEDVEKMKNEVNMGPYGQPMGGMSLASLLVFIAQMDEWKVAIDKLVGVATTYSDGQKAKAIHRLNKAKWKKWSELTK